MCPNNCLGCKINGWMSKWIGLTLGLTILLGSLGYLIGMSHHHTMVMSPYYCDSIPITGTLIGAAIGLSSAILISVMDEWPK